MSKTNWNSELSSWSDEDLIFIFHEYPDLADRLRKILAEPVKVSSDDLAHEIWAAAQTAPGEGIEDAVKRISALLARYSQSSEPMKVPSFVELTNLAIQYGIMAGPVLQGSRYAHLNEGERFNAFMHTILACYRNCDSQPIEPLTDEHKSILKECCNKAMEWAMRGRIPECGFFGQIAQDLDYLCEQLGIDND